MFARPGRGKIWLGEEWPIHPKAGKLLTGGGAVGVVVCVGGGGAMRACVLGSEQRQKKK